MNLRAVPIIRSITHLRYEAPALFRLLKKKNEPVYITRNNKPVGILLSPQIFSQLWSLYEDWRDQKMIDKILDDSSKKDFVDLSDFDRKQRKKLGLA